ncbi:MAG: thiol peroxidase [Micropruina sp.]|uniref:thiol peroxidase n=1 Tax=Micropruina sp. TaxID=2737536 RepID=UPI0039E70607
MAITLARGVPVATAGDPPAVGTRLPSFTLTLPDLTDVTLEDFAGRTLVLNIFPSVDTGVCAMSVRRFNELAAGLPETTVLCVSQDLPFALGRFCGAEGIADVVVSSAFRSSFGQDYGVALTDGPMRGLLARTVVVAGPDGVVRHVQVTESTGNEPDYDAAVAAVG